MSATARMGSSGDPSPDRCSMSIISTSCDMDSPSLAATSLSILLTVPSTIRSSLSFGMRASLRRV